MLYVFAIRQNVSYVWVLVELEKKNFLLILDLIETYKKRLPYPYFQWLPNGLVISFEIRVFGSPRSHFKNLDLSP
jgi:hypothetical protein